MPLCLFYRYLYFSSQSEDLRVIAVWFFSIKPKSDNSLNVHLKVKKCKTLPLYTQGFLYMRKADNEDSSKLCLQIAAINTLLARAS